MQGDICSIKGDNIQKWKFDSGLNSSKMKAFCRKNEGDLQFCVCGVLCGIPCGVVCGFLCGVFFGYFDISLRSGVCGMSRRVFAACRKRVKTACFYALVKEIFGMSHGGDGQK